MEFTTIPFTFRAHDGLMMAGDATVPITWNGNVVVLQQGSTLCDRDGNTPRTNAASTLYRRVARLFSEHGISTVRHDKRQWNEPRPRPLTYSLRDRVEDLKGAWQSGKGLSELAGGRFHLVGHSEGGVVAQAAAVELAAAGDTPSSICVLASPAMTMLESLEWRASQAIAKGTPKTISTGTAMLAALSELRRRIEQGQAFETGEFEHFRNWHEGRSGLQGWESWPWMREHAAHDPMAIAETLPCPALYVHGARDRVVNPASLGMYQVAVSKSAISGHRVELLPDLGHYLEDMTRKAFVVSDELIRMVAGWVRGK